MAWWPSLWTNLNTPQNVLGTVDRTHLLSYSLVLMPISFLFSQELFQTGTPFPVQPDQHHLWTSSRRPYTVYLASPIVITEPCHSSSKGCTPMAGYSLKNWREISSAYCHGNELLRCITLLSEHGISVCRLWPQLSSANTHKISEFTFYPSIWFLITNVFNNWQNF